MKQIQTTGIILSRIDYGEADRIVTLLTPDQGKLRLMARGVRKIKSKLAGGIELFSVSDISFIHGRGEIGTLVSTRLIKHYGRIVQDIDRVQLGYALIKLLNKATEDQPDTEYFELLDRAFSALDDAEISLELIELWFQAQLLKLDGHTPNLVTDKNGNKLSENALYDFDFDTVGLYTNSIGNINSDQIKSLRLLFSNNLPVNMAKVRGLSETVPKIKILLQQLTNTYIVSK